MYCALPSFRTEITIIMETNRKWKQNLIKEQQKSKKNNQTQKQNKNVVLTFFFF